MNDYIPGSIEDRMLSDLVDLLHGVSNKDCHAWGAFGDRTGIVISIILI